MRQNRSFQVRVYDATLGTLSGYLLGWLIGWIVVDPNFDLWALLAFVLSLLGLLGGLARPLEHHRNALFGLVAGAYLGWIVRTMMTGDHPTLFGTVIVFCGSLVGWSLGKLSSSPWRRAPMIAALASAFLAGNTYGLVSVLLPSESLRGWIPVTVISGVAVGAVVQLVDAMRRQKTKPENSPIV